MDLSNIIPITIRDFNSGKMPRECKLHLREPFKIERGSDYEFVVKKIKLPINSWLMPIDLNKEGYQINFQYEDKFTPYKDLAYGPNIRTIAGRIYSVKDFLSKLNELFEYYELGIFTLDPESELISFTSTTAAKWANIVVYMERKLCTLLDLHFEMNDYYEDPDRFWYRFNDKYQHNNTVKTTQDEFNLDQFYRISSITVNSNLTTGAFFSDNKDTIITPALASIDYNPQAMRKNRNITLIPSTPMRYSITNPGVVKSFELDFRYTYDDGGEVALFLDVNEAALFEGYFEKIEKIIL